MRTPQKPPTPPPTPLLANELARRDGADTRVRPDPLRVRWNFADLVTLDGHRLKLTFTCSVRALDNPTERQMLAETFLGTRGGNRAAVTVEDIVTHLAGPLQAAAAKAAGAKNAADWLGESSGSTDTDRQAMTDPLRKAAEKIAFSSGIEVLAPFNCDLESPSFQTQKIEALERQLAERRVAGQVEHFEKAAQLLKQFDSIRQTSPDITVGAVLTQVSPSDQGAMLQTLLLAAAKERAGQSLWAVAGQNLLKIDPRVSPPKLDQHRLPDTLGPLRSVQPGEIDGKPVLLVGARSGIMVIRTENPGDVQSYVDPELASQMGFSRAVSWNGGLWACHGDGGIVSWTENATDKPRVALRPYNLGPASVPLPQQQATSIEIPKPQGTRNLTVVNESRLAFTMGEKLVTVDREGIVTIQPTDSRSEIVTLLTDARSLYVIREDGTVTTLERQSLGKTAEDRRGGKVAAAGTLPWLGSIRLLLATDDGPIQCIGTEDGLVTQYQSNHRGLRLVTAAADLVAAVSADRQRLVVWNSWDGKKPMADFSVYSIAKHRVADVDFV